MSWFTNIKGIKDNNIQPRSVLKRINNRQYDTKDIIQTEDMTVGYIKQHESIRMRHYKL